MLNFSRSSCRSRDHQMVQSEWEVLELWEDDVDDVQSSLLPHAIISVISDVTADDADASLTSCEVSAIVSAMVCRKSCGAFRNHPIHPVSNPSHAILQSIYLLIDSRSWFSLTLVESTEESFRPLMMGKAWLCSIRHYGASRTTRWHRWSFLFAT